MKSCVHQETKERRRREEIREDAIQYTMQDFCRPIHESLTKAILEDRCSSPETLLCVLINGCTTLIYQQVFI